MPNTTGIDLSADVTHAYSYNPSSTEPLIYCFGFAGLTGVTLAADMTLNTAYQGTPTNKYAKITQVNGKPTFTCAAIIDSISWSGDASHPIKVSMWVTKDNQLLLWGATTVALTNTTITAFKWWAGKYDDNTKQWFEWCHQTAPANNMNGQLAVGGNGKPIIDVANDGMTFAKGAPALYNINFQIVSAGNYQGVFTESASPTAKAAKAWGSLQSGTAKSTLAAPTDS
jgi:hypothetical protein